MTPIHSSPTAPARGLRSATINIMPIIFRLLLLPLVLLLRTHAVLIGGVSAVADVDSHYARRLAACPVGTYSANGLDSPSACQQVAAGYYPSKTAIISTPISTYGLWTGITASPDLRYMAATMYDNYYGNAGSIYISSDSGMTWTAITGAGSKYCGGITSTPDFTKLAFTVSTESTAGGGNIYFSVDRGDSWAAWTSAGRNGWMGIACSPDFSRIVAASFGDGIGGYPYVSINGGATWSALTGAGSRQWFGVTASPDFVKMAAFVQNVNIYMSSDSGVTWTVLTGAGSNNWAGITSSPDFTKLAATAYQVGIYVSTDSGVTWNILAEAGSRTWVGIAASPDFSKFAATTYGGNAGQSGSIYQSGDAGVTWVTYGGAISGVVAATGGATAVNKCPPGMYSEAGSAGCTLCAAGSYATASGSTACSTCNIGYASPDSYAFVQGTCSVCAAGYYGSVVIPNTSGCTACAAGYSTPDSGSTAASACSVCAAGYYGSTVTPNTSGCTACAVGTYKGSSGNFACLACGVGTYASTTGNSACLPVAAGYYSSKTAIISTPGPVTGYWTGVTASPDFRYMAATVDSETGNIYKSSDSGVTWTVMTDAGKKSWQGITSNPDFAKLAATAFYGNIYFSLNGGDIWTAWTSADVKGWKGIACSPDFSMISVAVYSDYLHMSINGGATWSALTGAGSRKWYCVTASSDFVKMAAGVADGFIYMSSDSGVTWIAVTGAGSNYWQGITSSPDFAKLAVVTFGRIYVSADSGETWNSLAGAVIPYWTSITSSPDFRKFAAVTYTQGNIAGSIYQSGDGGVTWVTDGGAVSGVVAVTGGATAVSMCPPGMYSGAGSASCTLCAAGSYATASGSTACSICQAGKYSINLNVAGVAVDPCIACAAGYSTPGSGSTAASACSVCAAGYYGSTVTPNTSGCTACAAGTYTSLSGSSACLACGVGTFASSTGNSECGQVAAGYYPSKTATISTPVSQYGDWNGVAASPDFQYLAATLLGGNAGTIYISSDSGVTWTAKTDAGLGDRYLLAVTSTPDFAKLAATVYGGSIYFSVDKGISWTACASAGAKKWKGIASSPDFSRIAATTKFDNIYLSVNGGVTWSALMGAVSREWTGVTASPDFVKMAVCVVDDYIYMSNDSGVTWTAMTGAGTRNWQGITSTPDFAKLAAAAVGDSIYMSVNSGVTWNSLAGAGSQYWWGITASPDFTKFAAVTFGAEVGKGSIYQSNDGGVTWVTDGGALGGVVAATGGATAVGICPPGMYSGTGSASCTFCAAGSYAATFGSTVCSMCVAGSYSTASGSVACTACGAGKYSVGPTVNLCPLCVPGSYAATAGSATCSLCPAGKYSAFAGMLLCADVMPGYSTALGASQPTLCNPSFYSDAAGSATCIACPSGSVTTFSGANSKKQCVSPASNFIQGYFAVLIDVVFGFQYLLRGRFHRVAFVRLKRILESLSANAGGTIMYISYLRVKASSEHLNITTERRRKTWSFILSIVFILLFVSSLSFLHEFSTIFFKALVIFKSLDLNFDFGAKIAHIISQFGHDIWSQVVTSLLTALTKVLRYVAYFKIDVAVIAVNCQGATAPFTMFLNMLVLGTAMMFIDGRFQEFLLLRCNGLISGHSAIIGKHVVKEWYMRQDGTLVQATKRGKVMYYSLSAILLVLQGALSVDLIQTLLQFIISTVNISVFFEKGLMHGYDKNCNVVAGWTGAEASIAFLTSMANLFFILPALYTVSRVLIPRLPPGVASFDTTKDDEPLFRSYIGLHRVLKLFSYLSPDLWMSFLTSKYLHGLSNHIPARASMSSASLSKRKAEELKAVDDTDKVSSEQPDTDKGSIPAADTLLTAIETPPHPTYRIACNAKAPYIGLYRCKSIACKYKRWHHPTMYLTDAGDNYVLVKIARTTGLVASTLTYDVYHEGLNAEGRNAADLAVELNSTSDQFVVVLVVLTNEHTSHRLEGGLAEAVLRCGGSREIFGASKLQGSYLLVGVPGCGDRSGYECVSVNSEVEFCVDFSVLKPEHGKIGWKIDEEISSSKSFLTAAGKTRSKLENIAWKQFKQITLPTYWDLCVMECKAMLAAISQYYGVNNCLLNIVLIPVLAVLAAAGLGHAVTSVGRRAMYVVYWNYSRFLMFAAGIVTPDLTYIFDIHENIHRDSCVWNDASVVASHRLQDIVSHTSDNQLFTDKQSSVSSHDGNNNEAVLPTSVNIDKVAIDNKSGAELQSDGQQRCNRYEERKKVLERQVLQNQLRADYGICLYASIATRATLLQLFPYISFISMFAAFTSTNPYFVYDKYLESNLQEGIVRDPFTRWRQMEQQEIDLEYELRTKETREDSYVLPVPPVGESNAYGTRVEVDTKNHISRKTFKKVAAQDKPLVREWEVYLQGVIWYVTGSRHIQYGKGVFKFIMSVLLLYCGDESSKLLVAVMMVGLSPFVLVQCLQVVISLGTSDNMCITDEELIAEREWVLSLLQAAHRYLLDCLPCLAKNKTNTSTDTDANANTSNSKSRGDQSANDTRPSPGQPSPDDNTRSAVEEQEEQAGPMTVGESHSVVNPIVMAHSASSSGDKTALSPAVAPKPKRGPNIEMSTLLATAAAVASDSAAALTTATATADSARAVDITRSQPATLSGSAVQPASIASHKPAVKDSSNVAALSRSRVMAMEFEEIAERASTSSASATSRQVALDLVYSADSASVDTAHSLSRSRAMAIQFEAIAERASMSSASTSGKGEADKNASTDIYRSGSGTVDSKQKQKQQRVPAASRDFAAAIEDAKRRADMEYSL